MVWVLPTAAKRQYDEVHLVGHHILLHCRRTHRLHASLPTSVHEGTESVFRMGGNTQQVQDYVAHRVDGVRSEFEKTRCMFKTPYGISFLR